MITRHVEPIIDPATWECAQQVLRDHTLITTRRREYALRGLMHCSRCGLRYIGVGYPDHGRGTKAYYVCSGKHNHRKLLRPNGEKCASKAIRAEWIEQAIWADVQHVLAHPTSALQAIAHRLTALERETAQLRDTVTRLKGDVARLHGADARATAAKERFIALNATIAEHLERALACEQQQAQLVAVRALLEQRPPPHHTQERQRLYLEMLIASIRIDTADLEHGKKAAVVTVTYGFGGEVIYRP